MIAVPEPRQKLLLDAALLYASWGWRVIPLHTIIGGKWCSCGSQTCADKTKAKHPRIKFWQREGTVDAAVIAGWWTAWPDANIGIVTGAESGLVVVDLDHDKGGYEGWIEFIKEHTPLIETVRSITGSGGSHILYKHPGGDVQLRNSASMLAPGVDVRGDGGYIVAPPSRSLAGPYSWDLQYSPDETPLASLPNFLRAAIEGAGRSSRTEGATAPGQEIEEGGRNAYLASLGGSLRRRGMDEEEIGATLAMVNERRCKPPLDEDEVRKIAVSMARYEPEVEGPRLVFSKNGHSDVSPGGEDPAQVEDDSREFALICMSDVVAEPIDWLWEGFIARKKFVLWEGDPGIGKTFALLAAGTAVTTGTALPGGEASDPQNVVLMTVEDDLADTIRPRLDAMGADLSRFFAYEEPLTFGPEMLAALDREMERLHPALLVFDPIMAYVSGKLDIYKPNHIRMITTPLRMLAKKHNCAIVGIRHLTKGEKQKAIYRGNGGMDWVGASRLVVLVGNDPDNPGQQAIVQTKSNLGQPPRSVSYTLTLEDGFKWAGHSSVTAERMLMGGGTDEEATLLENAKDFVQAMLEDGPKRSELLKKEAAQADIAYRTLVRAKASLHVRHYRQKVMGDGGKMAVFCELPGGQRLVFGEDEI